MSGVTFTSLYMPVWTPRRGDGFLRLPAPPRRDAKISARFVQPSRRFHAITRHAPCARPRPLLLRPGRERPTRSPAVGRVQGLRSREDRRLRAALLGRSDRLHVDGDLALRRRDPLCQRAHRGTRLQRHRSRSGTERGQPARPLRAHRPEGPDGPAELQFPRRERQPRRAPRGRGRLCEIGALGLPRRRGVRRPRARRRHRLLPPGRDRRGTSPRQLPTRQVAQRDPPAADQGVPQEYRGRRHRHLRAPERAGGARRRPGTA